MLAAHAAPTERPAAVGAAHGTVWAQRSVLGALRAALRPGQGPLQAAEGRGLAQPGCALARTWGWGEAPVPLTPTQTSVP